MKLRRPVVCLIMVVVATAILGSCSVYRWVFGKPTSFAFADASAAPAVQSTLAARAESESLPDYKDYGVFAHETWEASDILPILEANGTKVAAYTPETFSLPAAKIVLLQAGSDEGFWVLLANEGVFGEVEYFDFTQPVYATENLLWKRTSYNILYATVGVTGWALGGGWYPPDIQVVAPGYTDAELPNTYGTMNGEIDLERVYREYLGQNKFALTGMELFNEQGAVYSNGEEVPQGEGGFWYGSETLVFRDDIAKPTIYRAEWYVTEDLQDLPAQPTGDLFWSGNTWNENQIYSPVQPNSWVDIPFAGVDIAEDTQEIRITIRWELEDIVELWDFGENGLHFLLAPDYLDRFSVEVEQLP